MQELGLVRRHGRLRRWSGARQLQLRMRRALFARSRLTKKSQNDADRLRKYLARFGLEWSAVKSLREAP